MQPRIWQKALLACGILASLTYVATDIFASLRYSGYSFSDQAISDLFAIGAPTSGIVVPLVTLSSALAAAFAFAVWAASGRSRTLQALSLMIFANAMNTPVLWNLFPMHMPDVPPTVADTIRVVLATNALVLLTVVFGIAAFTGSFRTCSQATVLVLLLAAVFSVSYVTAVAAHQPTPGRGLAERLSQYGYQFWQAALAVVLLREGRQMMLLASAFKTACSSFSRGHDPMTEPRLPSARWRSALIAQPRPCMADVGAATYACDRACGSSATSIAGMR